MIKIKKSQTADTRTCDYKNVTKETLRKSSIDHILDVQDGLHFFRNQLLEAAAKHDYDKLTQEGLKSFHDDFVTGFKRTGWWDNHRKIHRHHLAQADGVPLDVNLIDVLEYITDCVMAGMARSGEVYDISLRKSVLQRAFHNTVELLKQNVEVVD